MYVPISSIKKRRTYRSVILALSLQSQMLVQVDRWVVDIFFVDTKTFELKLSTVLCEEHKYVNRSIDIV